MKGRIFTLRNKEKQCLSRVEPRNRVFTTLLFRFLLGGKKMKLFNSLTNKKEEFVPSKEGMVSMYVCGPTVYNHAHIGNIRPMLVFDVLRRVFEYRGLEVIFVSNYTDVDDKIIKRAKEEGIDELALSNKYIEEYRKVRASLHVLEPTYTPKVTKSMDSIILFIEELIKKGYAYQEAGDVYFDVTKIQSYGSLSKIKTEDLLAGASERVSENDKKHSPIDFVLWKETKDGIAWLSPWSKGRPGWHTECVVMIHDIFGDGEIDIHGGGQDLKFPHHENEVAQSIAFQGNFLARFWMHNQMLNINNQKMSKSLGNVMWAKDVIAYLGATTIRWLMLSTHYRNPLNYTDEVIDNVKKEVSKVENVIKQAAVMLQLNNQTIDLDKFNKEEVDKMVEALEDDLNTSLGLANILQQVKNLNQLLRVREKDDTSIQERFATLIKMLEIFGFEFTYPVLSKEDIDLYLTWTKLKQENQFDKADEIRVVLMKKGIM